MVLLHFPFLPRALWEGLLLADCSGLQGATVRAYSVSQPLQKSLAQPSCLGGWGSQLQEDRSQCPYYGWSASEVEGEAGPSRQPPETQCADCVWVALSPPLSNVMAASFGFLLTFPTLSCSCMSHGLTQRAGRMSLLVRGFVTQAQSSSNLPPSPPLPGQELQL